MVNKNLQLEITKVESQLSSIHCSLESALEGTRGRRLNKEDKTREESLNNKHSKTRARSQPPMRCTPDNIHIISINTGEDSNEEVSGVLLSNKTQRVKPAIPDKPKDISFAVRNIIRKKEAAISDKNNKLSINPTKREQRYSQADSPSDLVLNIQFEILKLLSEKDDLIKENEVLKHYRQSYMKLQKENTELREAIELLTVVPHHRQDMAGSWQRLGISRTSPDGQEQMIESEIKIDKTKT